MNGYDIATEYNNGNIKAWAETTRPGIALSSFNLLADSCFTKFKLVGQMRPSPTQGRKMFLHEVVRAVLGQDTPNYPQETGDCTAFGAKNAIEYLTCAEIAGQAAIQTQVSMKDFVNAARLKWRPLFPSFNYGVSRCIVGGGQMNGEGSCGSWVIAAAQKYGNLFADDSSVPHYSGSLSNEWGNNSRLFQPYMSLASQYLLGGRGATITTWDDLCTSIVNGYPNTTASDIGYSMEAGRDGFHVQNASWSHQMCIIGIDETYNNDPYGLILNSWGDVHGHLKDFQSDKPLPVGVLRVRRRDIEKHLRAGETYAWSGFNGFREQALDKSLFLLG